MALDIGAAAGGSTAPVIDACNLDNLLAGLAWLREANSDQIRRLWFPAYTAQGVRKVLRRLEGMELIERRMWSLPRPRIGTPAAAAYDVVIDEGGTELPQG